MPELLRRGVEVVEQETFGSAVEMGWRRSCWASAPKAHRAARTFKEHDEQALQEIADVMKRCWWRDRVSWLEIWAVIALRQPRPSQQVDQAWDTSACGRMHNRAISIYNLFDKIWVTATGGCDSWLWGAGSISPRKSSSWTMTR